MKKTLKKVAQNWPRPLFPTVPANSPKLIFHVMKFRDQTSVLLSVRHISLLKQQRRITATTKSKEKREATLRLSLYFRNWNIASLLWKKDENTKLNVRFAISFTKKKVRWIETNKKSCKSSFNATGKSQKNRLAL